MRDKLAIGVDIGGTKINIAVINNQGIIIEDRNIKTPAQDKKKLLEVLIDNLQYFNSKYKKIEGIGIATAGRVIFPERKIAYTTDNLKEWDQSNLYQELKKYFSTEIFLDNDVNAALISELKTIENYQMKNIIFITIGTGLGGALAVKGEISRGNSGSVGEFGHIILYPDGEDCNCGKKGCAEQYISGRAYQRRLKKNLKALNLETNNKNLSIEKIEREIKKEKGIYYQTLKEMCKDLAILLENLKNTVDYDLCIFGGSFSVYQDLILKSIKEYSRDYQNKYYQKSEFKFSDHKNKAGVIGAALMVFEENRK